jgi:predicted transcriptional regulator
VDELPLSQSTVSQHLKELKNLGLIKGTIEGPSVCYCINTENWAKARKLFGVFFEKNTPGNCC